MLLGSDAISDTFMSEMVLLQPMLGFKSFHNTRRVIAGIELMQMVHKGPFCTPHR